MNGLPQYEIRRTRVNGYDSAYEIYELPAPATPHVAAPHRLGGLNGAKVAMVEHGIVRRLRKAGVKFAETQRTGSTRAAIDELEALRLALLFRAVAPMRSRERIDAVIAGIDAMSREEVAYWLGMAIHRKSTRRVLSALRIIAAEEEVA